MNAFASTVTADGSPIDINAVQPSNAFASTVTADGSPIDVNAVQPANAFELIVDIDQNDIEESAEHHKNVYVGIAPEYAGNDTEVSAEQRLNAACQRVVRLGKDIDERDAQAANPHHPILVHSGKFTLLIFADCNAHSPILNRFGAITDVRFDALPNAATPIDVTNGNDALTISELNSLKKDLSHKEIACDSTDTIL